MVHFQLPLEVHRIIHNHLKILLLRKFVNELNMKYEIWMKNIPLYDACEIAFEELKCKILEKSR